MKKYGVFDIESRAWIHFVVLGAFDGTEYRTHNSPTSFLDAINRKKYDGFRWYAHNGGRFDFLFLLDELLKRGWIERIIERGGRIIALKCRTSRASFEFADSYSLLPASLRALGEGFQTLHRKTEIAYEEIETVTPEVLKYLENDVFCLYEILSAFFQSDYVGTPQLTIASQALHTFRTQFLNGRVERASLRYEDIIRQYYYSGGRVEVYKGYGKGLNVYDVNSLYPFAMIGDMPIGEPTEVRQWRKGDIGFYCIEVKQATDYYISPLLMRGNRLLFVNGRGEYHCGSPTLEVLNEHGIRFTIKHGLTFRKRAPLFDSYVNTFYQMKARHKGKPDYMIYKLLLNSLYGKFGQSRTAQSIVPASGDMIGARSTGTMLDEYGYVLIDEVSKSRYIMPYIAAYITERARVHHFRLMNPIAEKVYYCDTDSIITTQTLPTGKNLGDLSCEGEKLEGVFLAPKTYGLKKRGYSKIAFKGFPHAEFSFGMMKRALIHGLTLKSTQQHILSFRECLRRKNGILDSAGQFLKTVSMEKNAALAFDKRTRYLSARHVFDTKPITYQEAKNAVP